MSSARLVLPQDRKRKIRFKRALRALWHDSIALASEFRTPVLLFIIVVLAGGWLYGELSVIAGYPRTPFIDLPYFILRMMVFEPPTNDPPPQPYLIAFWYLMPLLAVFILGRGIVDFVRLFVDRSERRSAWGEAVASTYRNHLIILGVGHVGLRVTRTLVGMGFEVIGIEQNVSPEVEAELAELGVPLILMDGKNPLALEKAGLAHAQAFIACTSSDQTNLEVVMRVRDLNPSIRIVARMWDSAFSKQIKQFIGVNAVHSASELAAPAFAGAAVGIELTQTLRIDEIDYSMLRLKVEPQSFLDGGTVGQLQTANDMDIVLHGRAGKVDVQPDNTIRVAGGDTLVIFARHDHIIDIVNRNRHVGTRS